ncbi:MAG: porin family protein, partial [Sinobacteraceae bacterium]|nr:porin family protein [Nevskiaceae bacterium]
MLAAVNLKRRSYAPPFPYNRCKCVVVRAARMNAIIHKRCAGVDDMGLKGTRKKGRLHAASRWVAAVGIGGTLALCALPAAAETGPYIGLEVGQSLNPGSPIEESVNGVSVSGMLDYGNGLMGGMTFGYALPGHLRPELEVTYRRNSVNSVGISGSALGLNDVNMAVSAINVMGNLWFDFESRGAYFYFGGGIGDLHLRGSVNGGSDTTDTFGGQLGVGLGVFFTPQLSMGIDYRYTSAFFHSNFHDNGGRLRTLYRSQAIMLGFRYSF